MEEQQEYQQPFKSKMITFETPPFFQRVRCFYGTRDELEVETEFFFDDKQEWLNIVRVPADVGGFCLPMVNDEGSYQLIWINSDIGEQLHSAIWHESLHATFNIIFGAGCQITMNDNELATYMQGYIAEGIISNLVDDDEQKKESDEQGDSEVAQKRSETRPDASESKKMIKDARKRLIAHVELYRDKEAK